MWNLYVDEAVKYGLNQIRLLEEISHLHQQAQINQHPLLVQIESESGKRLYIGLGNTDGLSVISYGYCTKSYSESKHVESNYEQDKIVAFNMGTYESEFGGTDIIKYTEAIQVLEYFLQTDNLDKSANWVDD